MMSRSGCAPGQCISLDVLVVKANDFQVLQRLFPDVRKPDLQVLTLSAHEILREERSVEGADDLEASTKYE